MTTPDPRIMHPENLSDGMIDGLNVAWQLRDEAFRLKGERDALRAEVAALKADAERLRGLLRDVRERVANIGPGADLNADPADTSPEDAVAHDAGLICQDIDAALRDGGGEGVRHE